MSESGGAGRDVASEEAASRLLTRGASGNGAAVVVAVAVEGDEEEEGSSFALFVLAFDILFFFKAPTPA